MKENKVKRIYKCKECIGKLCSVSMIMDKEVKFDYKTISCTENKPCKSWTWVASIDCKRRTA